MLTYDLANGIDAGSLSEARPVVWLDMLDGVNAEAVKGVLRDEPADPRLVKGTDLLALGVEIRQAGDPALLHTVLVVIVDLTARVVGAVLVQRFGRVVADALAHVVRHDIAHHVHALREE